MLINKPFFDRLPQADRDLVVKAADDACSFANDKMKNGQLAYLLDLQRNGMKVVIPDAALFRAKAKPAVEKLFNTQWNVTMWEQVLAQ
jgi:TRAP-type transport system periplasmic protein